MNLLEIIQPEAMDRQWLARECHGRAATLFEASGHYRDAACCWTEAGDNERAVQAWLQAGADDRAAPLLLTGGNPEAALASFQRWLSHLPESDETGRIMASLGVVACLKRLKRNLEPARKMFLDILIRIDDIHDRDPMQAAACWCALGQYGQWMNRPDIIQTGYENAILCYAGTRWEDELRVLQAYRSATAENRYLADELENRIARLIPIDSSGETDVTKSAVTFAQQIFQDFRPLFLGADPVPDTPAGLLDWLADTENFSHRSAALLTLIEQKNPKAGESANRACTDEYWPVRMVAAAAEMLEPGLLTLPNRNLLSEDHVYWVKVLLDESFAAPVPAENALLPADQLFVPGQRPDEPDQFNDLLLKIMHMRFSGNVQ